ncbi:hypothetical protein DDE18_21025 [Nocardioides gansuensis]|uniref:Metallo-beta-lactamase domain-containing protein n=1 Tax=Nocardioides gansuensis TaxID=2138300 RepID=A0A2T8F588_9ACTN|nr:hypothetical protein [Nocardioides gansuensis]PVG80867.1 hypothetical protein DDE18_21025 [Nocardioides gansuensis]
MSELVVRSYNVGFGDAILVSIPEATNAGAEETRHLLIDVGNLLAGDGNDDKVFTGVVQDISDRTGGTVDLYLMTHEHLDHVQGLLAAERAGVELAARHAWLTGSAHPAYYETHPEAKEKMRTLQLSLAEAHRMLQAEPDPWLEMMVRNNSAMLPPGALGLRTSDYVDHLRGIAPEDQTHYVDNTTDIVGKHPFHEAVLRILAPEEDTSSYYRKLGPTHTTADELPAAGAAEAPAGLSVPPVGVDPGAFYDLQASRRKSTRRQIMEIDKANNNTSVVLELEWRGWRLLFAGDAELGSWKLMHEQNLIKPVHFVKVSHHGSHNGTYDELFDELMPAESPDGRERHALVSTHDGDWDSVPDTDGTLSLYSSRCTLHDTRALAHGAFLEIRFPG